MNQQWQAIHISLQNLFTCQDPFQKVFQRVKYVVRLLDVVQSKSSKIIESSVSITGEKIPQNRKKITKTYCTTLHWKKCQLTRVPPNGDSSLYIK